MHKSDFDRPEGLYAIAEDVFRIESEQIAGLADHLTDDFARAIYATASSKGKVIVSGMGKSGLIGSKIAATLASTGTPSFFLHPAEAYHGDLGMIGDQDVMIMLSNSGETDEVLKLIPFLKSQGNCIIALTGNPHSTLARHADHHLNVHVGREACPLSLAPMASTTAMLVMGDALAAALMTYKGFEAQDFARFHPGGTLGRKLLLRVADVMHTDRMPTCDKTASAVETVHTISSGRYGLAVVLDAGHIVGIVTDGDLRRAMELQDRFFTLKAAEFMTKNPKTIAPDASLMTAQEMMTQHKINALLVAEADTLRGIVQIYDLEI